MVEWYYDTTNHSFSGMSPFEALYEYPPPRLLSYVSTIANEAIDQQLETREEVMILLRENLLKA